MPPVPENVEMSFPDDGGCFGCSPSNPAGLRLRFRRVGDAVQARHEIADQFHGAPGIAHGGIVATLLDEISCVAVVFVHDRRVVTGELTIRYEQPIPVEVELALEARVTSLDHQRYAIVEAAIERDGVRLARSTGRFFYQRRSDSPAATP